MNEQCTKLTFVTINEHELRKFINKNNYDFIELDKSSFLFCKSLITQAFLNLKCQN